MERNFVLFRLEGCPYCAKAEKALNKKNIKYRKIEVPRQKSDRNLLKEITNQDSVPILIEIIGAENQDDDIITWLENKCC